MGVKFPAETLLDVVILQTNPDRPVAPFLRSRPHPVQCVLQEWQLIGAKRKPVQLILNTDVFPRGKACEIVEQRVYQCRLDLYPTYLGWPLNCFATLITGHITVIAPDGRVVRQVKMPDVYPTNICFGGSDMKTAYITLSGIGQLAAMDWPEPGLRLNFQE